VTLLDTDQTDSYCQKQSTWDANQPTTGTGVPPCPNLEIHTLPVGLEINLQERYGWGEITLHLEMEGGTEKQCRSMQRS